MQGDELFVPGKLRHPGPFAALLAEISFRKTAELGHARIFR
jgi:hypothetical protein